MKASGRLIFVVLTCLVLTASAYAQSPREQLQQMVEQLQKTPSDNALRERIIKLGAEIMPAPVVPPEAKRPFVMAGTYQKEAKKPSDFVLAIAAYQDALKIAPWWGDAYYNLSVSLESAGELDRAKDALELYLLTKPKDAEEAQNRLYALDAKKHLAAKQAAEKASSPEAPAASQKQRDDNLVRSLDGVRFDCPDFVGNQERKEYWLVINGSQLNGWIKMLQVDPDRARVDHVGEVLHVASVPIIGTLARKGGPNWEETYRISSDQVVRENERDGRAYSSITCRRH